MTEAASDWQQLPGWLEPAEGELLQSLARDKAVLEIGSYKGRSTVCLAAVAKVVHAIDWGRGDRWVLTDIWVTKDLLDNLREHEALDRVILHVGKTAQVGPLLAAGLFDLVFVDAAHDEESVVIDTALALRVLKPGGVLVFHDWGDPGVKAGAAKAMASRQCVEGGRVQGIQWFTVE